MPQFIVMKFFNYILILFPVLLFAQVNDVEQDSTDVTYLIIKGDSISRTSIGLDEVMLLHKLKFGSREDRIRYLILRRKTLKVYPYAKLASERLDSMNSRLATLTKTRDKKRYTRMIQKYIEGEFSDELKKCRVLKGKF